MDLKDVYTSDYVSELTGDVSSTPKDEVSIGERIRQIRTEKGLSLEALAEKTGFDLSLLQDIESSNIQPQLGTVMKLSRALDKAVGGILFGSSEKAYCVTRKGDRKVISRSTDQKGKKQVYTYHGLAPNVQGRHMEPLMVELAENVEGAVSSHEGEEFIFVLDGIVLAQLGEDRIELSPGDSLYYLSQTPHRIAAKKKNAKILAVLFGQ